MWNKFFVTESQDEVEEGTSSSSPVDEHGEQLEQQNLIIEQLKTLLRENEMQLKEKEANLSELSSKHQRCQIQSKAKIASLTNQLKARPVKPQKDEGEFDDTSSSDSSDYSTRGKVILLRKQLETAKQQLDKSKEETNLVSGRFEQRIKDLEHQLAEKAEGLLSGYNKEELEQSPGGKDTPQESDAREMHAQIVYKDMKIIDLNNQILEQEKRILDLQEHIREKEEVLQSRNLAVHLMSADMSRKGKTVADELEETRGQMKIMQSNFADIESDWKLKFDALTRENQSLNEKHEREISEKDRSISNSESCLKKLEASRYELAAKNAELQKQVVLAEEKFEKQRKSVHKQLEDDLKRLKEELKLERAHTEELQKSLNESTTQSESKILKARVKERTKLKALERELAALKELQLKEQKTEEVTQLQQQVAILEEEKGTLQLRLIEVDEQISASEDLKSKNSELHGALKERQTLLINLEEKCRCMEESNGRLTSNLQESEVKYNKLKYDHDEVNKLNLALKKDVQGMGLTRESLEHNNALLADQVKDLISKNQELIEDIDASKDEKVSLNMKIIELEEIQENQEKNNSDQMKNRDKYQLQEDNKNLEMKCKELSELLQAANTFKQEMLLHVEDSKHMISELKASQDKSQSENNHLKNQVSLLNENVKVTQRTLEEKEKAYCLQQTDLSEAQSGLTELLSIASSKSISEFRNVWNQRLAEFDEIKGKHEKSLEVQNEMMALIDSKEQKLNTYEIETQQLKDELNIQKCSFNEEKGTIMEKLRQMAECMEKSDASVNESESLIFQLRAENQDKVDEIKALNVIIQERSDQVYLLEEEKLVISKEVDNLKNTLWAEEEKTKAKISSLLEQISDLESEVYNLSKSVSEKVESENSLQEKLQSLLLQFDGAVKSHDKKERFYQESFEEKDQLVLVLQEQLTGLKDAMHSQEVETNKTSNDLMKYEKQLEDVLESQKQKELLHQDSYKEKEQLIASLQEQLTVLQTTLMEKDAQMNKVNSDLKVKYAKQVEVVAENQKQKELLYQHSYHEKEQVIVALQGQLALANDKLEREIELNKVTSDTKGEMECQLKEANEHLSNILAEKASIMEVNLNLKQVLDANEDAVNSLSEAICDLQTQLTQEVSERTDKSTVSSLINDVKASKHFVISLQEQISSYQLSTIEKGDLNTNLIEKNNRLKLDLEKLEAEKESLCLSLSKASEKVENQIVYISNINDELRVSRDGFKSIAQIKENLEKEIQRLLQDEAGEKSRWKELDRENQLKIQESDKTLLQLQTSLGTLQATLEEKEVSLQDTLAKIEDLEKHKSNLQEENSVLINDLEIKNVLVNELTSTIESLNHELSVFNENSSKSSQDLNNQIFNATIKNEELQELIVSLKNQIDSMSDESEKLTGNNDSLRAMIYTCVESFAASGAMNEQDKECTLADLVQSQIKTFQQQSTIINKCCSLVNNIFILTNDENKNFEVDTVSISNHIENACATIEQLRDRLVSLQSEKNQLKIEIQNMTDLNNGLNSELCDMKRNYTDMQMMNEDLSMQLNMYISSFGQVSSQIAEVERKGISEFQNVVTKLDKMNSTLEGFSSLKDQTLRFFVYRKHFEDQQARSHNRIEALENSRLNLQKEYELITDKVHILEKEKHEKDDELKIFKEQANVSDLTLSSLQSELKILQGENEQLKVKVSENQDNYSSNFTSNMAKLLDVYKSFSSFRKDLLDLKMDQEIFYRQHQEEFCTATTAVSNLGNKVGTMTSDFVKAQEKVASLMEIIENNHELQSLTEQNAKYKNQIENLKLNIDEEIRHKLSDKDKLIEEQDLMVVALNEKIESLKLELDQCLNEKKAIAVELEQKELANQQGKELVLQYCQIKDFIHAINDVLVHVEESKFSSFTMQVCTDLLDEDFRVLLNQFHTNINSTIAAAKRLYNDSKCHETEICQLNSKISEINEALSFTSEESECLKAEALVLKCSPQEEVTAINSDSIRSLQSDDSNDAPLSLADPEVCVEKFQQSLQSNVPLPIDEGQESENVTNKGDKSVVKLKLFKNKIDKLTKELRLLRTDNQNLTHEISELGRKSELEREKSDRLNHEFGSYKEYKEKELLRLNSEIKKLKDDCSSSISNQDAVLKESQEYKQMCERREIEIQRHTENAHQLNLLLRKSEEKFASVNACYHDARNQCDALLATKTDLENRLNNMEEHADMMMSDNETYQTIVEKLKRAKAMLEKDVQELKNCLIQEKEQNKTYMESELLQSLPAVDKCTESQHQTLLSSNEELKYRLNESEQKLHALKAENLSLYHKIEQFGDAKHARDISMVDEAIQKDSMIVTPSVTTTNSQTERDFDREHDSDNYKLQISSLNRHLETAKNTIEELQQDNNFQKEELAKVECRYKQMINNVPEKSFQSTPGNLSQNQLLEANRRLEMELQQALSSLHKQSVRSEEMSLEANQYLNERNSMKLKLNQFQQHFHQLQLEHQSHAKEDALLVRSSEPKQHVINIDESENSHAELLPTQNEITVLHQRLLESEKICKELRKANEALDSKLMAETEQRQLVEEELGFAQRQLMPMERENKDEYHLLLGDLEEPEMLVETNFSITRKAKTHAHKLKRWIRGRRLYLHKICQRKKYSELLYIFYICAIHLWLGLCIFQH